MAVRTIKVIMNGVTGRMGYRQHLVRSILPIRDDGGVVVGDDRIQVVPVLVGRNADKLAKLAELHGVSEWTTDLDAALADPEATIYFDAQVTSERTGAILAAIEAGKHIFTEKPIAESVLDGQKLVAAAQQAGTITGVVHDKLYLPGLVKLKRLVDLGFFGRILSVRGEFGYWVFEGDVIPAQRPSWNYRAEDGGGMVLDMFCHWNYVLENLFGPVEAVMAKAVTHIPERWDEQGNSYTATADDAAYGIFELEPAGSSPRSTRPGPCASTAASWSSSRSTAPTARPPPACSAAASSRGPRRPSRSGIPTCPPTRTSGRSGKRCPTSRSTRTVSARSGSSSSATWTPVDRTATTWPPGSADCSWSRPGCGRRRKAAAS